MSDGDRPAAPHSPSRQFTPLEFGTLSTSSSSSSLTTNSSSSSSTSPSLSTVALTGSSSSSSSSSTLSPHIVPASGARRSLARIFPNLMGNHPAAHARNNVNNNNIDATAAPLLGQQGALDDEDDNDDDGEERVIPRQVAQRQLQQRQQLTAAAAAFGIQSTAAAGAGGGGGGGGVHAAAAIPAPAAAATLAAAAAAAAAAAGGGGFVAVDIEEDDRKMNDNSSRIDPLGRFAYASPEDVFVHIFSFLDSTTLGSVAVVNRAWQNVVYDVSLWSRLDLSPLFNRVDDNMFVKLIESRRFRELRELSLEGCSGLTARSFDAILQFCPHLTTLLLTECGPLPSIPILDLVRGLRSLQRLELYRASEDYALVPLLLQVRPHLNLGFFFLAYCAVNGFNPDDEEHGLASCRHEGAGFNAGACSGRITGRPVYSNRIYPRAGNYPQTVLFSCQAHVNNDLADSEYHQCVECERLFKMDSMWTNLICRTCFDFMNLSNKENWTALSLSTVNGFSFSDVVSKTVRIADRKNLPTSLRSYGHIACRLDYQLPAEHSYQNSSVPVSVFLDANGWRVDETVRNIKTSLNRAKSAQNTRALLAYDDEDNIELLADRRVILDGREGEDHMRLTLQAWTQSLNILYPIVIVMAITMHFTYLFRQQMTTPYDGRASYTAYLYDQQPDSVSSVIALIIVAALLVFFVIVALLVYRFRDLCEQMFKRFLVLDILLILMFGGGAFTWLLTAEMSFILDAPSFIMLTWNFGFIGLVALYFPVPARLHHFYLIFLNAIMSVMLVVTLNNWIIFAFVCLASLADLLSDLFPRFRVLSPFIIPANVQLLYDTPRILYNVGGLRLRAADLMWYGMMTGVLGPTTLPQALVTVVCVIACVGLFCFVAPFVGINVRPLYVAFVAVMIASALTNSVGFQFFVDYNLLGQSVYMVQ